MRSIEPGPKDRKPAGRGQESRPDQQNGREGGDDALESSPTDTRSDEKVIVNEQRENKIVNAPSQTSPNTSEGEEIVD